jgi:hypothetical protein
VEFGYLTKDTKGRPAWHMMTETELEPFLKKVQEQEKAKEEKEKEKEKQNK